MVGVHIGVDALRAGGTRSAKVRLRRLHAQSLSALAVEVRTLPQRWRGRVDTGQTCGLAQQRLRGSERVGLRRLPVKTGALVHVGRRRANTGQTACGGEVWSRSAERVGLSRLAVKRPALPKHGRSCAKRVSLSRLAESAHTLLEVRRRRLRTGHTGGGAHVGLRSV